MKPHALHSQVAVLNQPGQPLELVDIHVPELRAGEVLVKVTTSTICGSDLHTFTGRRKGPLPTILGHEIIGIIAGVHADQSSSSTSKVRVGDRVTWSIAASCGSCERCCRELPQKCDSLFKYGHENFNAFPLSGGLSEYCVLQPGTRIVTIPAEIPDAVACPASCATATVAAAFRTAGDVSQRRVLITGAGMLGLTACAFASANAAADVVVCDLDESRLQLATKFGATQLIRSVDTHDFDFVFEMSGSSGAVAVGIQAAAIGGVVVLVGSVSPSKSVELDPEQIVRRLITIHGVHNYKPDDLVTAVDFLQQHHQNFPFADLVEATFPLHEAQAALEHAEAQRPIRVAVRP